MSTLQKITTGLTFFNTVAIVGMIVLQYKQHSKICDIEAAVISIQNNLEVAEDNLERFSKNQESGRTSSEIQKMKKQLALILQALEKGDIDVKNLYSTSKSKGKSKTRNMDSDISSWKK